MVKLKLDDTSKPTPKNKVSVLFILSLAVILAVIGVSSWSFFGKHNDKHIAPVITASTAIDAPIEAMPQLPSEAANDDTAPLPDGPPTPEISSAPSKNTLTPKADKLPELENEPKPENESSDKPANIPTETRASIAPDPVAPVSASPQVIARAADSEELAEDLYTPSETDAPSTQQEETPSGTEEEADAIVDTPERAPSPTGISPHQPAADGEAPDEITVEATPDLPERAGEAASEALVETEALSILQPELTAPSAKPEFAEQRLTPADVPVKNETDASKEAPENFSPPTFSASQAEASETEPKEIAAKVITPLWQANAAAFDNADNRPRIAIVVSEVGVNSSRTREAIEQLPAAVTLGFNPYGQNLQELVDQARKAGHEVLLQLPMEPVGYPRIDPGPQAMRTDLDENENLTRLDWALDRFTGYAGVTNQMGSKFTATADSIRPVLAILKNKDVFYLDSRTASNSVAAKIADGLDIPVASNDRFLDHKADGAVIDARLAELEAIAKRTGSAIGIAYPHSVTFRHLSEWADTLDQKELVLAPVSAIIKGKE